MSEQLPEEKASQLIGLPDTKSEVTSKDAQTSLETEVSKQLEASQTGSSPGGGVALPALPDPIPGQTDGSAVQQSGTASLSADPAILPAIADDADLIEKEWVTRAKHIVHQTREDPYLQNKEVNKVKAEYLKKRYNKDIKQA